MLPEKAPRKKTKVNVKTLLFTILKIIALPAWVGLILLGSEYSGIYPLYWIFGKDTLLTPVWTAIANSLVYALAFFVIVFLSGKLFRNWKTSREELGLKGFLTWNDLGLAPVGFFVYLIIAFILASLFSLFPFFNATEAQETGFNILATGLDKVVAFFALVVVPPIFEEIIFRGWLYGKLRAKISGKASLILSILITSVLFGIMHGQWNVGINVFAMSIVLCAMREITGTIYSGILLHMLKNAIAFAILYIFKFMI